MQTEIFRDVKQTPATTSAGPCDLPILYRDATQVGLLFRTDLESAAELMRGSTLEPMPIFGKALVAVYAWEYRDTTVGKYNELGLGIQCRKRGSSPSLARYALDMTAQPEQAIWVVTLPVTTRAAYAAGVEIWGYPKYVAPIEATIDRERARFRLADEVELTVGRPRGPKLSLPIATFTAKESELIRTVIPVGHKVRIGRGSSGSLRILGSGRTADAARHLGLEHAKAVACFRSDSFQAVLDRGTSAGPATTS